MKPFLLVYPSEPRSISTIVASQRFMSKHQLGSFKTRPQTTTTVDESPGFLSVNYCCSFVMLDGPTQPSSRVTCSRSLLNLQIIAMLSSINPKALHKFLLISRGISFHISLEWSIFTQLEQSTVCISHRKHNFMLIIQLSARKSGRPNELYHHKQLRDKIISRAEVCRINAFITVSRFYVNFVLPKSAFTHLSPSKL